jgi:hypothetical protein
MNDYMNQKWRNFLNEDKKPARRNVLTEDAAPSRPKSTKVTRSEKVLYYPKFQLTDDFGKKGTPSRMEAEMFFSQISHHKSITAIISAINKFLNPTDEYIKSMSIKKCLGTLTMLNTFSTLVHKFDPSSAGFLMEPFMAAVYGGKGKQIKTGEGGIEDIWDFNGKLISLKLLAGGPIHGSLRDLRRTIRDLSPNNAAITYILVEKIGDGEFISDLIFYEFTIGTDGREWHWISDTGRRMFKGTKKTKTKKERAPTEEVIDYIPRDDPTQEVGFKADEYTNRANPKTAGMDIDPKYLKRYAPAGERGRSEMQLVRGQISFAGKAAPQFNIPWATAREGTEIGRIKFGKEDWIQTTAQKYVNVLEGGVTQVYEGLDTLTKSINSFLMTDNASDGGKAQQAAVTLVTSTECVVNQAATCDITPEKK